MSLVTTDNIRDWFDPVTEISDDRIEFSIGTASRMLRSWVTDDVYSAAEEAADDDTPDEAYTALASAEGYLTMYNLLLNSAARLRAFGVVKQEQDAGGSVTNNVVNQYLTPDEVITLRQEYYDLARSTSAPYIPEEGSAASSGLGSMLIGGGWADVI